MTLFKDPSQILEVAVRIERKGVEFYKSLSDNAATDRARDVFSYLAAEEEKHIGIFRQVLDDVAQYQPKFSYPGEYGAFIEELATLAIDSLNIEKTNLYEKDFEAAISLGIQVELESIVYYTEIRDMFQDEQKELIQKIIDEEKLHLLELKAVKAKPNLERR